MKKQIFQFSGINKIITSLYISIGLIFILSTVYGQEKVKRYYQAIELNGILCGYSEIMLSETEDNGKKINIIDQNTFMNFSALGRDIIQKQKFTWHINPSTGNFFYHDSYHDLGDIKLSGAFYVEGNSIRSTSSDNEEDIITALPENTILPNTQFYPHLLKDFETNGLERNTYQIYDVRTGKISKITYEITGREQLNFVGEKHDAIILNESDPLTGMDTKIWINSKNGMRLKMVSPNHVSMYLTDESVKKRIKSGSWDDIIFIKTNKSIKDIRSISYLEVRVSMEPLPVVSPAEINVPGQKFMGSIDGNRVEGIFEVEHKKYDGENVLLFPLTIIHNESIKKYLEAEEMIESDNPVLIEKAREITKSSKNSWEASCRISRWVAENIDGSIFSGSARETYDKQSGNCGAQSMLMAALCRAAGIPARVVWGCLYTPEYGGSFGHHGWNEIYMGEAGWIPLDVTIHETDYIDSGHIRLGVLKTRLTVINFREMEILDFKL